MGQRFANSEKGIRMNNLYDSVKPLTALPAEELFVDKANENVTVSTELFLDLCIEYGRKIALEDYLTKCEHKYSLDKAEVMAILGIIEKVEVKDE